MIYDIVCGKNPDEWKCRYAQAVQFKFGEVDPEYITWGPRKVKNLRFAQLWGDCAMCGVCGTDCPCTAHIGISNSDSPESKFTQIMNASELAFPVATPNYYYSTPYPAANASLATDKEKEEVIEIPEQFRHVFYGNGELEFAGMARHWRRRKSTTIQNKDCCWTTDCGATSTLTNSFLNMTSIVPKIVTIQLAMEGSTMKTSHMGDC